MGTERPQLLALPGEAHSQAPGQQTAEPPDGTLRGDVPAARLTLVWPQLALYWPRTLDITSLLSDLICETETRPGQPEPRTVRGTRAGALSTAARVHRHGHITCFLKGWDGRSTDPGDGRASCSGPAGRGAHRVDAAQLLVEQPGQRELALTTIAGLDARLDLLLDGPEREEAEHRLPRRLHAGLLCNCQYSFSLYPSSWHLTFLYYLWVQ